MLSRGSMMARLALLVGICLVTIGQRRLLQFPIRAGRRHRLPGGPDGPGEQRHFRQPALVLRNVSGVETSSFVFGEPIRFDFAVENRTARQLRLLFPDAQTDDFLVVNAGHHPDPLDVVRGPGLRAGAPPSSCSNPMPPSPSR